MTKPPTFTAPDNASNMIAGETRGFEEMNKLAESLPSSKKPKSIHETLYTILDLIQRNMFSNIVTLNMLSVFHRNDSFSGERKSIPLITFAKVSKLCLKLAKPASSSATMLIAIIICPLIITMILLSIFLSAATRIVMHTSQSMSFKSIADQMPPSVGRVEVNA